jgi:RNA polymerase sigma factor (sigma-70 family)
MPVGQLNQVLRHLRRAARPDDSATDAELLECFVRRRDEAAFEALVRRHGPLVLGVCRRVLRNEADAEDAFQATFVVLARKAASLRQRGLVGNWLYGVAHNTALKARAMNQKRRAKEQQGAAARVAAPDGAWQELQGVLDEELSRLPEKYRVPVVLCDLEGKAIKEAARLLGVPQGTAASRLARGRAVLAQRLARHGIILSGGALAALVARHAPAAGLSRPLVALTVKAVGGAPLPGAVAALADGVVKGILLRKLQALATAAALAALLVAGAVGTSALPAAPPDPTPAADDQREPAAKEKAARSDVLGDALPAGALTRLGTVRWRHGEGLSQLGFAAGGKELVTAGGDGLLRVWDVATGKELRRFGREMAYGERPGCLESLYAGQRMQSHMSGQPRTGAVLAPDGATAALAEIDRTVSVWDVATGRKRCHITGTRDDQDGVVGLGLSADGKRLASQGRDESLVLWDAATGKELRRLPPAPKARQPVMTLWALGDGACPTPCVFSPDGQRLATLDGNLSPFHVRVWDLAGGKELWHVLEKEGIGPIPPCFSSDGKRLVRLAADRSVRVHDAADGRELRRVEGDGKDFFPTRTALSPDGRQLAVVTGGGSVLLYDLEGGQAVRRLGEEGRYGSGVPSCTALAFSPDGKTLAQGAGMNSVRLWDVASGKARDLPGAGHLGPVRAVIASRDGKDLTTVGGDGTVRLWDALTGKERQRVTAPEGNVLALSPDGRALLTASAGQAGLWDVRGGKEARRFPRGEPAPDEPAGGVMLSGRFSADGRRVAAATFGFKGPRDRWALRVWDAATGKELHRSTGEVWTANAPPDFDRFLADYALSPDGAWLLTLASEPGPDKGGVPTTLKLISLWDVATGRALWRVEAEAAFRGVAFSPDGRTVAVAMADRIVLLETASGRERARLKASVRLPAFAPDGRTLVAAEGSAVRLWDVARGDDLGRLTGHQGRVEALAFAPDGRALVTGSADSTALVWDVGRLLPRPRLAELRSGQAEALWDDLASDDAGKAYRAVVALSAAPKDAVALLKERLKPVAAADAPRVAKLIADLDSDTFDVREKAAKELEPIAEQASDALRKALKGSPSAEVRRRVEALLAPQEFGGRQSPQVLRQVRAVEVLESAGTPEARQLLEALARGVAGARLTREARAALERLGR